MQTATMPFALLALLATSAVAATVDTNPLGKVLQLLEALSQKVSAEGDSEEKSFQEYSAWCTDTLRNKGFEIQSASSKKQSLEAEIGKLTANAGVADTKINQLASSIATGTSNLEDATTVRAKDSADFAANEKELVGVIDTLGRAINIISREAAKNPAAFAQMDASSMSGIMKSLSAVVEAVSFSSADKATLMALVQSQQVSSDEDEDEDVSAPAAASYKSHGSGILDVLEDLKEKAEEQLSLLRKAETNTKHSYELLKQSLEDQASADNKDLEQEKAARASAEEGKATAEGDLAGTVKDLADSQVALETAQRSCDQTAADHEASAAARTEELKVIAEAKQILESSTGGAVEQAYSFLQSSQATATGSRLRTRADLAGAEVVTMVNQLAKKHHSSALAQLASQISAVLRYGSASGEDPFAKVKSLISDLISKLESQASTETSEKAYCDGELAKSEAKKGELETDISKLTAKIDSATAKSASLKADVVELQAELATLAKEQAAMDKFRQASHAAYVQAKADYEAGLTGVRKALSVLREYYGGAALVQQPAAVSTHSKAAGAGSSIIGILDVVASDFAKSLATEEAQESDSEEEYEKITQENAVTKTLKDQDVKYKTQESASLDKTISELTSDRSTTDAELSAVLEYYAKIKERCIAKPESYEERVARRASEINGLKEALQTLESETAFTQRRKRGLHGRFLGA